MAYRLSIQLCQIIFHIGAFIFKTGVGGIAEERCKAETVNITCSDEEFVFFESAFFGRLNRSRCYNRTENEAECVVDVRNQLQTRFGQNQSVSFSMADEFVYSLNLRCPGDVPHSMTIAHRCVNAFEIKCDTNAGIIEFPGIADGRWLKISCKVTFPRIYSVPLVEWLRNDVNITANFTENHHNISSEGLNMWIFKAMFPLNASDDGTVLTCIFTFKSSDASNRSNTEEVNVYRWNYTALVCYGPKKISSFGTHHIAGIISGIAVALFLLGAGIAAFIRCRGSRVHKEPVPVVETEDKVQKVELAEEDAIVYLDLNGVRAILPSAFNRSEYVSIDHSVRRTLAV